MDRVPDNYDLFLEHDRKMADALERRPKCEYCKEHIQDDYYFEIDGCIVCDECLCDFARENCKKTIS